MPTSAVVVESRDHTPTRYAPELGGVQVKVAAPQSRTIVHVVPLNTHHLNWYGDTPPLAEAVKVTGTPVTGDMLAVIPVTTQGFALGVGAGAEAGTAYGIDLFAALVSAVVAASRAHTPTRYAVPATLGVHVKVAVVLQSRTIVHVVPL